MDHRKWVAHVFRLEDKFYRLDHARPALVNIFVTGMLTRDLFAVANLLA